MSSLCATACCPTTTAPPVAYATCNRTTRKIGVKRFGLVKCDYAFTDVTDPAEWATAISNGDIQWSPLGNLAINAPTQTVIPLNACGDKITTTPEYLLDYKTLLVAEDDSDFTYFQNVTEGAGAFKLFWIDCNGLFYFPNSAVDAIAGATVALGAANLSIGFDYSITQTPYQANNNDLAEWTMQMSITQTGVLKGIELAGVAEGC